MSTALEAMRAERARLDREIRQAEERDSRQWNTGLDALQDALGEWLRDHAVGYTTRERKNEEIWNVGNGALTARFGHDEPGYARGLTVVSGLAEKVSLEWNHVPAPEHFTQIIAALLGRTS